MKGPRATQLIPIERVERMIHLARGEKVLLDADLAKLYGVTTGALNRAVKRNANRFPADFMFEVTTDETAILKCQSGISSYSHGGRRRSRRYAFIEPQRERFRPSGFDSPNVAPSLRFIRYEGALSESGLRPVGSRRSRPVVVGMAPFP